MSHKSLRPNAPRSQKTNSRPHRTRKSTQQKEAPPPVFSIINLAADPTRHTPVNSTLKAWMEKITPMSKWAEKNALDWTENKKNWTEATRNSMKKSKNLKNRETLWLKNLKRPKQSVQNKENRPNHLRSTTGPSTPFSLSLSPFLTQLKHSPQNGETWRFPRRKRTHQKN